ncbi:MAG: hypothetical protein JWQ24_3838 [Tardiphaga sp.]|nr:hypothetical protein [Tardiphaga sp.]
MPEHFGIPGSRFIGCADRSAPRNDSASGTELQCPRAVGFALMRKAGLPVCPPRKTRGMTRRKAQLVSSRAPDCGVRAASRTASPFGAPSRRFLSGGPCFRVLGVSSSRISPAFSRTRPAAKRQSPVVGPDDDPRPPGSVGASHVRRRRIPLHSTSALEKRPSRAGRRGVYSLVGMLSMGVTALSRTKLV